jgi:hypothetical protein
VFPDFHLRTEANAYARHDRHALWQVGELRKNADSVDAMFYEAQAEFFREHPQTLKKRLTLFTFPR